MTAWRTHLSRVVVDAESGILKILMRQEPCVPNNTISRHAAAYTTNARFVAFLGTFARPAQEVWLPGNDVAILRINYNLVILTYHLTIIVTYLSM